MSEPFKVVLQPDNKIIVGGNMAAVHGGGLQRLNPDGSREGSFAPGPSNYVFDLALQPDGAILFVGQFTSVGGTTRNRIARVHGNGSLDSTFDPNADGVIRSVALRPDGSIVIGGQFTYVAGDFRNRVALLNPNGTLRADFNPNVGNTVWEAAVQPDGLTLVGGNFMTVGGMSARLLARLLLDGSLDETFIPFSGAATGSVRTLHIQPDQKILAGGTFGLNNLVRFLPRPPSANQPPVVTAPPAQQLVDPGTGVSTAPLPFSATDPEGLPVTVSATSSNPGLVAPGGIVLAGAGASRTVQVSTVGGVAGTTTITLAASDGVHTSTASFTVSVTLQRGPARNLVAETARNNVILSWEPPLSAEPIVGYELEVGFTPGATALRLPVGNTLRFSAVAPDGRFFVRVIALTAGGPSGPSNEVQIVTGQSGPPHAPLSLLATVVGTAVTLQWTENSLGPTVAYYRLDAGSGPGRSDIAVIPLSSNLRGIAASAPPGTYFVRLHAGNASGIGPASSEVVLTLGSGTCTIPESPNGFIAGLRPGGVVLAWNAPVSGAIPTGYRLDVGSTPGANDVGSFPLPVGTSLSAPAPSGTYYLRLAATNVCGSSPPTADVLVVVP
jgi:uncharacterized delta-60 repeat protein